MRHVSLTRPMLAGALLAAGLSLLPAGSFVLDPNASRVQFFVRDNRGGFAGVAGHVDATVVVRDQDGAFVADVEAQIDTRSITTGNGVRDGQMRRDFLQSDRYRALSFRGTVAPVEAVTGLSFRAEVRGRLTIKDTTRDIEFPVRVTALRDTYLVEGTFTIRMTEFGIPIPRFLIFVAEDPVDVTLKLRFSAQ